MKGSIFFASAMALALNVNAFAAEAPNHLEPGTSIWSFRANWAELAGVMKSVFSEAGDKDVRLWAYHVGSPLGQGRIMKGVSVYPAHDSMIVMHAVSDGYKIVSLQSPVDFLNLSSSLGRSGKLEPPSADYHTVKPWRCEIGVSKSFGDRIVKAWRDVLSDTRFYTGPVKRAPDATFWVFNVETGEREYTAQIGEVILDSNSGQLPPKLVEMVEAMTFYCVVKDPERMKELEIALNSIEASIKKKRNERTH